MICFCVPKVCQILEETVSINKHNTEVMSRSHQGHLKDKLAKTVTMITYLLQDFPISFSNVSSLKGAWASVWWHLYNFSIITSIYINLTLCWWAISKNFIIVISINLIGFGPIGYTFTSIHVATMSPSISSMVNKTVFSKSGPHMIIIYRPTVDRCIVWAMWAISISLMPSPLSSLSSLMFQVAGSC